ncbi:hypothetical protein [Sinorhizobium sp. GL28]|uniref:hypothetical protein n=1 Tax=Sinorhizobium sp. GL28 TaxID=1358418 RepID=UPI00071D2DBB|nr:hypothetical protein [Sinorhizobium sp. GL28]KSV88322.1 hypothetical protein N184_29525 [Sinorhizobium sp. GL28]
MYFAIDTDQGHTIAGWIVLDNPSAVPEMVIKIPGRESIPFRANVLRPDLKDHGLHSTGLAGFQIDRSVIDDLPDIPQMTLVEAESNLPIFRRNVYGATVPKKLLLMEVGTFPQVKLLKEMMVLFDLTYPAIERFSLETTSSIIGSHAQSLFISGYPNWQRHGGLLRERGFLTAAILRDPFEELAERLLTLAHMKKWSKNASLHPFLKHHSVLLDIVEAIEFQDDRSILAAFRGLAPEQYNLLRSPMTAAFGCYPEEEVQRRNVSVALDNLSHFDLVGTRERLPDFAVLADSLIGKPIFEGVRLESLPGVDELAATLNKIGMIADILDEDIALYSFAAEAIAAALGDQTAIKEEVQTTFEGGRDR